MKNFYLSFATGLLAMNLSAQQSELHQVVILNEGPFGGPVTVGSFNPTSKSYSSFDTINGRFASDVIIDNGFIYVAADSLIVKYDADTHQKTGEQTVMGVREFAIWNDQLLVTRGDVGGLPSYFQAYDKNSLAFLYEINGISDDAAEVKVVGDTAYIAVNGFGAVGKLAVVDLQNQSLNREIDLGPDGLNPENVELGKNGKIFTVNSLDWSNISVTKYDANNATFTSKKLGVSGGCGASALSHLGNIYFQQGDNFNGNPEPLEKNLGVYDAQASLGFWDTLMIDKQIYGMGLDSVNGNIYVSGTDFSTYGKIYVYNFYGMLSDSFNVGISPGTIAFDVRTTTGFNELPNSVFGMEISPNPTGGIFAIKFLNSESGEISIKNILGETVFQSMVKPDISSYRIDLSFLPAGIYFILLKSEKGLATEKVVKSGFNR